MEHSAKVSKTEENLESSLRFGSIRIEPNDINLGFEEDKSEPIKSTVRVRRIPYFFWLLGLSFIGLAIVFFVNMFLSKHSRMFKAFNDGVWWEYIVIICIIALGVSFFFAAKLETVEIDKYVSF